MSEPEPTAAAEPTANAVAIERACLDPSHRAWMTDVAGLVGPRLDAVRPDWRDLPASAVLETAAFGLLLGVLAQRYPQARQHLEAVAEAHPSFSAFPTSRRLAAMQGLVASERLVAEWVGPLLDVTDPVRLRPLCASGDDPPTQDEGQKG